MNDSNKMWKIIGGVVIGVVAVRLFFLDPVEVLGLSIFSNGGIDIGAAVQSSTFVKLLGGALVGGFGGLIYSDWSKDK